MTMTSNGLAKLLEECGELIQVAAKKQACMDSDVHWDGGGSLKARIEDEAGDVKAAIAFVTGTFGLDEGRINARMNSKLALFTKWHEQANDAPKGPQLRPPAPVVVTERELVLWLLLVHPNGLYGSEMIIQSDGRLTRGTVYTLLQLMVEQGLVQEIQEPPPPGSKLGRTRHLITPKGMQFSEGNQGA